MATRAPYRSYAEAPPQLIGGALCLDFANTVQWRGDRAAPGDRLVSYQELVRWAAHGGALGARRARELIAESHRRPDEARAVLDRAIALRETLARLAAPRGRRGASDLSLVNRMLADAPARGALITTPRGFAWSTGEASEPLAEPLWPILWSAAELLTSARLGQVRECADSRCAWLFLDASRNKTRRWCAMENCGNRAKVRRHYDRRRSARRASAPRSESR